MVHQLSTINFPAISMNRIDRLAAILIQLQSKKIVKAKEIADRFNISLRTVYRDVQSLEEGGVPIIGEAGIGYSIMEGYRLPPVMFTREEATAFLMAEKLLDHFSDSYNSTHYRSALYKIKSVLRSAEKEFITDIDEKIVVIKNMYQQQPTIGHQYIQPILKAISEKKVISISYCGIYSNELTHRSIEPVGIFLNNTFWYLIAWCRLRKDYRNFKTDRIRQLDVTGESFTTTHQPVAEFLERTAKEKELHKVVLEVKKEAARYLVTEKYYHGFVTESLKGEYVEMTFLTASLEGMARWFLLFGDQATILEPAHLKPMVQKLAMDISARQK